MTFGKERDQTLFNYLLTETCGNKLSFGRRIRKNARFDGLVKELWPEGNVPQGKEAVRKYFFLEDNPRRYTEGEIEKMAIPHILRAEGEEAILTEILQPFFKLPPSYDTKEYDTRTFDQGLRRFDLKRGRGLCIGDILVVRGEHIVDYLMEKDTDELKRILEEYEGPLSNT